MANITKTTIDNGGPILEGARFRDELLTAAGAHTFLKGTILARDTATHKMVPYVKGGVTNGNGVPSAVLTFDVVAAGAGDTPVRVAVDGFFRKERLIIDGDGTSANVDYAVIDLLRVYGLVPLDTRELNIYDN
jgi:hypothetical protein